MVERPILRFPNPRLSSRITGSARNPPRPSGPARQVQRRRFQATFDGLAEAFKTKDPAFTLREDPAGIAPERALVFVSAGRIGNFSRAAREVGLEIFSEDDLDDLEEFPEGFVPPVGQEKVSRTLYASMPTIESLEKILSLWNAHQRGEAAPKRAAPWWHLFSSLLELRRWGPEDRLDDTARAIIEDRLPADDNAKATIEFEIWPTRNLPKRRRWRNATQRRIEEAGGTVLDRSSISDSGFHYEAILAEFPVHVVRSMLDHIGGTHDLVTVEGVQFILPQTIGQALLDDDTSSTRQMENGTSFDRDAPFRAALFDGTPAAAHPALDGGVAIEDIHDLVRHSQVSQRYHATAMASLILRGDLDSDGTALQDSRLISVPVLVDDQQEARTPPDRLFVDMLHTTLVRLLADEAPLAPDVFVVNFSVSVADAHFAGRIGSLARLMDWWAAEQGVLFVISAGNVGPLPLRQVGWQEFENADQKTRRQMAQTSMQSLTARRSLLSPAEAVNGVAVGALSRDISSQRPPERASIFALETEAGSFPQITSALGLGLHRNIKPDILHLGGQLEVRAYPRTPGSILQPLRHGQRTGLFAASPAQGAQSIQRSRGTSPAAAMTTRAVLQSAEALTGPDGPYEGQELSRRHLALLTRALAVHSARWTEAAKDHYDELRGRENLHHARAKEEVCRHFGHGVIIPELMQGSPQDGATLVGVSSIRKDKARIFRFPLPSSMAGESVHRSMWVTITWFSPVNTSRAQYRLASLEALAADEQHVKDDGWGLALKADSYGPDANMIKRGSVWSRRLVYKNQHAPDFDENESVPIRVQCRDASAGGLNPDDVIEFAIAVTLQVEQRVQYDVNDEISQKLRILLATSP